MELWVRSQDKEILTKVSNVQYTYKEGDLYTDVKGKHYIGTYYDNLKILGIYATKERALEVLNEIQSIIRGKFATFIDTKLSLKSFEPKEIQNLLEQMAVYEMPEK